MLFATFLIVNCKFAYPDTVTVTFYLRNSKCKVRNNITMEWPDRARIIGKYFLANFNEKIHSTIPPRCYRSAVTRAIWNFQAYITPTGIRADFININIKERKFIPLRRDFVRGYKYISVYVLHVEADVKGGLSKKETCPWREISAISRILDTGSKWQH